MPLISNFPAAATVSFVSLINVTFTEGASLTCSKGNLSYSATPQGTNYTFKVYEAGVWTITAFKNGTNKSGSVEIARDGQYVEISLIFAHIYGVQRNVSNSSPEWTRTNDAAGLTATAAVGADAGISSFDALYPWSEMQRETLYTGDVMVRIPKFWFRRYRDGEVENIEISDQETPGYSLHPLFWQNATEKEAVYIGAYKTSSNNRSLGNAIPTIQVTRSGARSSARNKGNGWGLLDVNALSAIEMLMLVEFASNDVQTVIGYGYCNSNSNYRSTGSCDSVPGLTGVPSGGVGKVDVVYRGIEGFWGNVWEWVDGININNGIYYVCNDPGSYADDTASGYEALSFLGRTDWRGAWISQMGLDLDNPHILMPSAAESSGNGQTYFCDVCQVGSGWKVVQHGSAWDQGLASGLWGMEALNSSNASYTSIGSRLMYIPGDGDAPDPAQMERALNELGVETR